MQITINKVGMERGKGQDCPMIWASGEQPFGRREVNDLACGLVSWKLCASILGVAGSCILNPHIIGAVWIIEGLRSKRMNFRVGRQYWKVPSWEDLLKQQQKKQNYTFKRNSWQIWLNIESFCWREPNKNKIKRKQIWEKLLAVYTDIIVIVFMC